MQIPTLRDDGIPWSWVGTVRLRAAVWFDWTETPWSLSMRVVSDWMFRNNPCWSFRDIQWSYNMISFANPALPSNFIWHCLEVLSKPRGHELIIPHTHRHRNSSICLATSRLRSSRGQYGQKLLRKISLNLSLSHTDTLSPEGWFAH